MAITADDNRLCTDEPTDVLDSVRHTLRLLNFVKADRFVWKWVTLSAHSALQGAMVCHLSGSAQLGCLSTKTATSILEWHEKDRRGEISWVELGFDELGLPSRRPATKADRLPRGYMAKPDDLFLRLHDQTKRIEGGCGGVLQVSESQKLSFVKLIELRNQFTHFTPLGWSIELSGMPDLMTDIFQLVRAIAGDDYPFRHLEADERTELLSLLDRLIVNLKSY